MISLPKSKPIIDILMETTEDGDLKVSYDEENGVITFDWNEETHPEYNFLHLLAPEELSKMLLDRLEMLEASDEEPTV